MTPGVRNVVLIGLRGAGKTTAGRALAARLGWPHMDADDQVAALGGGTIAEIFARGGEAEFRRLESSVVARLADEEGRVISVGGGAVLASVNRAALRRAGPCIWLTAPPDVLAERIAADPASAATRPALTAYRGADEVRRLLAERGALYAELAALTVDTQGRSPAQVADEIVVALRAGLRPMDSRE